MGSGASIKIDSSELKKYEKKLNDLHRSAFPNAVRSTLNDAAFLHKSEISPTAAKSFDNTRNKSLFKKITGVDKATGWNIDQMKATSGINKRGLSGKASRVADNIQGVNDGTKVKTTKLVPHLRNRYSQKLSGRVRKDGFKSDVDFFDATNGFKLSMRKTKNRAAAFRISMYYTLKSGKQAMLLKGGRKGKVDGMVYHINRFSSVKTKKSKYVATKLYSYKRNNESDVKQNDFIEQALKKPIQQIPNLFQKNAEYQIKKRLNK